MCLIKYKLKRCQEKNPRIVYLHGVKQNFSSAQLSSAQLSSAQLSSAQLSSAQLSSAQLSSAQRSAAQLSSAQLKYICWQRHVCTIKNTIRTRSDTLLRFSFTDDDLLFKQKDTGNSQTTVLKPFSASGSSSYATNSSLAGLYILTLRATDGATSVHIYTTTTPDSDRLHPELPSNSAVTVVSTTRHSVSLMWKPSPTATLHGQPVHYCVAVNRKQNFPSQCSAMAHVFGDAPPTVPPHAGFGFAWEKTGSDVTRRPPVAKAAREQTSWYRCVGRKTTFTFLHGEPGQRYYFDVFAVHTATNVSSAYNGTSARTKAHARYTQLRSNRPRRYYVRRFKVERSFVYNLTAVTPMLLFTVQPCTTRVLVGLYRTSTLIRRLAVSRVQALAIGYPIPGLYVLTVSAPTDASFSFNVLVTSPPRLVPLPYPSLPPDTSVRVSGRTSRSVNLSWHGTRERQQYCLYRRAIDVGPFGRRGSARLPHHEADVCEGPRDRLRADKVRCRNFKVRRRRKTVITETVTGLRPDTLYVFDVYVRRRGGLTLPYRWTWARTKAEY